MQHATWFQRNADNCRAVRRSTWRLTYGALEEDCVPQSELLIARPAWPAEMSNHILVREIDMAESLAAFMDEWTSLFTAVIITFLTIVSLNPYCNSVTRQFCFSST